MELLSRDKFREAVFKRDGHLCVICNKKAEDAHHIIERRLWDDGGYYVNNGVSLCFLHHFQAEQTLITCDQLREAAGITTVHLPARMDGDTNYDKWGNIILLNGRRLRGELFYDVSVQKALHNILDQFSDYVKYPRTYHLPWSPEVAKDDMVLKDAAQFEGKEVIVTVKMDGENTSMYSDYVHARSIDSLGDVSRDWVKNLRAKIGHDIPKGWRLCGENMYEEHSIHYKDISSYFLVFSIWNEVNMCLSWDDTIEWTNLLDLSLVPVIFRGMWDEQKITDLMTENYGTNELEGYVVRIASGFRYSNFRRSVAKCVRKNHIKTHGRSSRRRMTRNELKNDTP